MSTEWRTTAERRQPQLCSVCIFGVGHGPIDDVIRSSRPFDATAVMLLSRVVVVEEEEGGGEPNGC